MNKYSELMKGLEFRRFVKGLEWPASELDILEFEMRIGFSLPADYRTFIADFGFTGGFLYVDPKNEEDVSCVDVFYGLNSNDGYDLLGKRESFVGNGRLSPHLLPIACGPGGHYCIALAGDYRGGIFLWANTGGGFLIDVAPDFETFLRRLRPDRD
jgi:hypothetical protein